MGKNINQLSTEATSFVATDKLYLGRSPYGLTDDRYFFYSTLAAQTGTGFVTVGGSGGAQYPTYYAAWTAGKFFTYQISNTTETQQYTFTGTNRSVVAYGRAGVVATFGTFRLLSSAGIPVNFYSRGISWAFTTPASTCISFGLGSNILFESSFLNATSSVLYYNNNGGVGATNMYLINTGFTLRGATNSFAGLSVFSMHGGTITCQASATACVTSASFVYFSPSVITGSVLAGKNEFINAAYLYISNVTNTTTPGTPGTDGMIMRATIQLSMTNYIDYNFSAFPTDFRVDVNGNGYLNNTLIIGQFALQPNTAITIDNSVLDSFTDATATSDSAVTCSNTQWIASAGSFTFPNNGTSTKRYSFSNCSFANSTIIANNGTQLSNCSVVVGDLTINDNVSRVKIDNIDVANDIFVYGNYCSIDQYSCGGDALLSMNAIGSTLSNGILTTGGVTVDSGCIDCTVFNTKALNALVDNGTDTQQALNLP